MYVPGRDTSLEYNTHVHGTYMHVAVAWHMCQYAHVIHDAAESTSAQLQANLTKYSHQTYILASTVRTLNQSTKITDLQNINKHRT